MEPELDKDAGGAEGAVDHRRLECYSHFSAMECTIMYGAVRSMESSCS